MKHEEFYKEKNAVYQKMVKMEKIGKRQERKEVIVMQTALAWGVILGGWFGIIVIGMIIEEKEYRKKRGNKK